MELITEAQIDRASAYLEAAEENYLRCLEDLESRQPVVFPYLLTENFDLLTPSEKDYLFFLLAVVWQSVRETTPKVPKISAEQLGRAEERNWTILQDSQAKGFHERLDPFFEKYPQEDLLAFLEDALADDEGEDLIAREAREPIFVTLKSILDCWVGA